MKSLREYIAESEHAASQPVAGDYFAINIREETLFETYVCDETPDGIVIYADDVGMQLLEDYGYLLEPLSEDHHDFEIDSDEDSVDVVDRGEYDQEGDMAKDDLATIIRAARKLNGMLDDDENLPEWVQSKINKAADYVDTAADYIESNKERAEDEQGVAEATGDTRFDTMMSKMVKQAEQQRKLSTIKSIADAICHDKKCAYDDLTDEDLEFIAGESGASIYEVMAALGQQKKFRPRRNIDEQGVAEGEMDEAKYQGREVPLGKPMKGDVKKSKVYVRGPKGNVVKVNFGQKGMKIKKNIPGRRKNFRARHNCDNPGPRWKARYWSCRAW